MHGPGVSTGQIAAQVGIARPQLYRHFSDADELYRAIAERVAEQLVAELAPVLQRPGRTPRSIIDPAVHRFVGWLAENPQLYRFVTLQGSMGSAAGWGDVVGDIKSALTVQIANLLSGYMAALGLEAKLAEPLAAGIVGLSESATERWLVSQTGSSRAEFIDMLAGWIWGILHNVLQVNGVELAIDDELPELPWPIEQDPPAPEV